MTTEPSRTDGPDLDDTEPSRRRWWWAAGAAVVAVVAVLAFGVFGVQTLFIDDAVDEAAPTFRSGAAASSAEPAAEPTTTAAAGDPDPGGEVTTTTAAPAPEVRTAKQGSFASGDHPGTGTAVVVTDGAQAFVRFEDDFATDNGPDLYAVAYVGGERIELGRLKGNQGAQNYELPASIDPDAVESVAVWCKRFDSTFTTAEFA